MRSSLRQKFSGFFRRIGRKRKVSAVDLKTLATISKVDTGEGPDAIVYDAKRGEVYVFNHKGNPDRDRPRRHRT